ncbi:MAG: hypothetical protein ACOC9N_00740 [Gemmatimonadota bacterium]
MSPTPAAGRPSVAVATLYQTYLVTRHTGRAVRLTIERMVEEASGPSLTVLDFSDVAVIDFSCADEVVARLLHDTLSRPAPPAPHYFLLDGLDDEHIDPVASALDRRGLAMSARTARRRPVLLGRAEPEAQEVWRALTDRGRARANEIADCLRGDAEECRRWLARLEARRLLRSAGDVYESLFLALGPEDEAG